MYIGSGGIRTLASEETGALNQRLRPLGHATFCLKLTLSLFTCLFHLQDYFSLPIDEIHADGEVVAGVDGVLVAIAVLGVARAVLVHAPLGQAALLGSA